MFASNELECGLGDRWLVILITIYYAKAQSKWRVKPGAGRRDEKMVSVGQDARSSWRDVLKYAATYMAQESGN